MNRQLLMIYDRGNMLGLPWKLCVVLCNRHESNHRVEDNLEIGMVAKHVTASTFRPVVDVGATWYWQELYSDIFGVRVRVCKGMQGWRRDH
jgi:hypothetical protein